MCRFDVSLKTVITHALAAIDSGKNQKLIMKTRYKSVWLNMQHSPVLSDYRPTTETRGGEKPIIMTHDHSPITLTNHRNWQLCLFSISCQIVPLHSQYIDLYWFHSIGIGLIDKQNNHNINRSRQLLADYWQPSTFAWLSMKCSCVYRLRGSESWVLWVITVVGWSV